MNDAKTFFFCYREDFQNGSHFSIISLWSFIVHKEGHCGGVVCQTADSPMKRTQYSYYTNWEVFGMDADGPIRTVSQYTDESL